MDRRNLPLVQRLGLWLAGSQTKSYRSSELLSPSRSSQPVWSDWSTEKAIQEGYKSSTYVYRGINLLGDALASLPWKVARKDGQGDFEDVPNHPGEQLLEMPNPFIPGSRLMKVMVSHLVLGGNAIFFKVRGRIDGTQGKVPVELWPILPDAVKPVPSRERFISHYRYDWESVTRNVPPEDVIHLMLPDPGNPYWGVGPVQAGGRVIDTEVEAMTWQKVSFQNRAISDGVFSFAHELTQGQWEEAREQVREQHQGKDNSRNPWVLGAGASWQPMSMTPAEMDFIESRKMTRVEISSLLGVPPPMLGIYDDATLANIKTARQIFWIDAVVPLVKAVEEAFNMGLMWPDFGRDLYLYADLAGVEALQANYAEKVQNAKALFDMGVPLNEISQRLELGFDDIPGGDVGYLPASLMPAGMVFDFDEEEEGELALPAFSLKSWNVGTEQQRDLFWKSFERQRSNWYGQTARVANRLLREEASLIASAYTKGGESAVNAALDKRRETWAESLRALYTEIIGAFGQATHDGIVKASGPEEVKRFDPFDDLIQSWAVRWAATRATLIGQASKRLAGQVITQGMAEGLGVTTIAESLQRFYGEQASTRAIRMARTEVVGASNYGSWAGAKQTGLNPRKVWVASRDDRMRDDHADIDGHETGIDGHFEVGADTMLHPGDPSASAGNTINCRCTLVYRT